MTPASAPTPFIDSDHDAIRALADDLREQTPRESVVAAFNWVRDRIRYDPYTALDGREAYRASAVLERGSGYCVQKAVLLAAVLRAMGIAARLGFADVRNHKSPPALRARMGTDLFVFHGFVEVWLEDRWLKLTPAFDPAAAKKAGALLVELDGSNDAMLAPVDPEGHPYIEYLRSRGSHDDLPFEELQHALRTTYGAMLPSQGTPDAERG